MKHTFSIFSFSDKEVDMICELVKNWVSGYLTPIKRATITKQVEKYAIAYNLLQQRSGRLYLATNTGFNPVYDLPVECMWRLVQPMLKADEQTGYSIVSHGNWEHFNLYPQKHYHASDRDLEAKIEVLCKLDAYHYIYFHMAGSTWAVYRDERKAA